MRHHYGARSWCFVVVVVVLFCRIEEASSWLTGIGPGLSEKCGGNIVVGLPTTTTNTGAAAASGAATVGPSPTIALATTATTADEFFFQQTHLLQVRQQEQQQQQAQAQPRPQGTRRYNGILDALRGGARARSASSVSSAGGSLLSKYDELCKKKPLITKSVTAAVVTALGNVLSQVIKGAVSKNHAAAVAVATGIPTGNAAGALASTAAITINYGQVAAFTLTGLIYVGPFYHYWYEQLWKIGTWLDAKFGASPSQQVFAQIAVDQTLGIAVFFPLYFFVFEISDAFLSWRAPLLRAAKTRCAETLSTLVVANWRIWPIVNFVNFRSVPPSLRCLVMNGMSVLWNILLGLMMGG